MKKAVLIAASLASGIAASVALAAEGRVPVFEPVAISQPGHYILTQDVSAMTGPILDIRVDGVSVDLNGHMLSLSSTAEAVIKVSGTAGTSMGPIVIQNGAVEGGMDGVHVENATPRSLKLRGVEFAGQAEAAVQMDNVAMFEAQGIIIIDNKNGIVLQGGTAEAVAHVVDATMDVDDTGLSCDSVACHLKSSSIVAGGAALALNGANGSKAQGNQIVICKQCFNPQPDPPGDAVSLVSSMGCEVSNNTLYGAKTSLVQNNGISVDAASAGVVISGNTISDFADDGINVTGSNVSIIGNLVAANGGAGITVGGSNNLVSSNKIGANTDFGILFATSNHVYLNNILRGNIRGAAGGAGFAGVTDGGGNIQ